METTEKVSQAENTVLPTYDRRRPGRIADVSPNLIPILRGQDDRPSELRLLLRAVGIAIMVIFSISILVSGALDRHRNSCIAMANSLVLAGCENGIH